MGVLGLSVHSILGILRRLEFYLLFYLLEGGGWFSFPFGAGGGGFFVLVPYTNIVFTIATFTNDVTILK